MITTAHERFVETYIEQFGPLSLAELNMPLEQASEFMLFLNLVIINSQQHLSLNGKGKLSLKKRFKWLSDADLATFANKTEELLIRIRNIYLTLPAQFPTQQFMQSVAEKQRKLINMYQTLIQAYNREIKPGMIVRPLKLPELCEKSFEMGVKKWMHEGNDVHVFIRGSFLYSQAGMGLKINLNDGNRTLAEASFYNDDDCLCVINVKSSIPRDSVSGKYNFIDMINHVIFNVWEKQANNHLAIFYRVVYFSSTNLGFDLDHLDPMDHYKQQVNFVRETALPYFNNFKNILSLEFDIVPKNVFS